PRRPYREGAVRRGYQPAPAAAAAPPAPPAPSATTSGVRQAYAPGRPRAPRADPMGALRDVDVHALGLRAHGEADIRAREQGTQAGIAMRRTDEEEPQASLVHA